MRDIKKIAEQIIAHGQSVFPKECCGLLVVVDGEERYFPCNNIAPEKTHFVIDPKDYASAEALGYITAIVHSHCYLPPEPSQADRVACEASGLPWIIVSLPNEAFQYLAPTGYKAPLVGREYSFGILDCYSLVRDWFIEERGIEIPDLERRSWGSIEQRDVYSENFRAFGFEEVPEKELRPGDVILMQIGSRFVNHAAVYLGDDLILHHLRNRLSSRDVYGGYWRKVTRHIVRYRQ